MQRKNGLQEDDIQKLHTTPPEQLNYHELLLSTICAEDLTRKHSGGWVKETVFEQVSLLPNVCCAPKHTGSGLLQSSAS
jgi:hypothetical protein